METYIGTAVSEGIVTGIIREWKQEKLRPARREAADPETEVGLFSRALACAAAQLDTQGKKTAADVGEKEAAIFYAQKQFLADPEWVGSVRKKITEESVSAASAISETGAFYEQMFASMEDVYLKERAADIRDITQRLLRILNETEGQRKKPEREDQKRKRLPFILAADDLVAGEVAAFEKGRVLAIVTRGGSRYSHMAILARAMGIPALTGVTLPEQIDGREAVVDGYSGRLLLDPDRKTLRAAAGERDKKLREESEGDALLAKEAVTKGGRKVSLYANIADSAEIPDALLHGAGGIGLFRTEYLYLNRDTYPTEEEQFCSYREAAVRMEGREVVIRTFDIGTDKQAGYFGLQKEANPALGLRAVRIGFARPELQKTQLRAILRAAAFGQVSVMIPMIASVWEVQKVQKLLGEARVELADAHIPFGQVRLGIMIETPAAVMMADALARLVSFFSIGTNDLAQYTLAADRQNPALVDYYDQRHPAVWKMIEMTVHAAHAAGIRCAVCGELAAEREMTEALIRTGIDELSVNPGQIPALKRHIRELDI